MSNSKFLMSALILGFILLSFGCSQVSAQKQDLGEAADFELQDQNGNTVRLSDYKGKVIILNFFTSACDVCKGEIPELNEFHLAHKDKDAAIIGIMLDAVSVGDLKWMEETFDIKYPILLLDRPTYAAYGPVRFVPTTYTIDRDFNVVKREEGGKTKEELEKEIADIAK